MLYYLWNSRPILLPKIIHPYLTRQPGAKLVHKSISSQDFSTGQPGARAVQNSLQVFFFLVMSKTYPVLPAKFEFSMFTSCQKLLNHWPLENIIILRILCSLFRVKYIFSVCIIQEFGSREYWVFVLQNRN